MGQSSKNVKNEKTEENFSCDENSLKLELDLQFVMVQSHNSTSEIFYTQKREKTDSDFVKF